MLIISILFTNSKINTSSFIKRLRSLLLGLSPSLLKNCLIIKNHSFCNRPTRYARIYFTNGSGLLLNLYNWAIYEDLKLKKEEEGKREEGELYI
jgi:hypothetical protein